MSDQVIAAMTRLRAQIDEYNEGTLHPVWEFAPSPRDVLVVLDDRDTIRNAVEEMLAEAKQINYDRAGKSEFDEGREVAYQYVLDLMNGGRS